MEKIESNNRTRNKKAEKCIVDQTKAKNYPKNNHGHINIAKNASPKHMLIIIIIIIIIDDRDFEILHFFKTKIFSSGS